MNSDTTRGDQLPALTRRVPQWLHALALVPMGVLATLVIGLVLSYFTADPGDDMAGVVLVYAVVIAVPLLAALFAWVTGSALHGRSPGLALALVVVSAGIGWLAVLFVAASLLIPVVD